MILFPLKSHRKWNDGEDIIGNKNEIKIICTNDLHGILGNEGKLIGKGGH